MIICCYLLNNLPLKSGFIKRLEHNIGRYPISNDSQYLVGVICVDLP